MIKLSADAWSDWENTNRVHFFHSILGPRTAWLLGTQNTEDVNNLALFSSIVHLGSNPALMGIKFRPVHVRRDSYRNIKSNKLFSLNMVSNDIIEKAHLCSHSIPAQESEFDYAQLQTAFHDGLNVPFLKDAPLSLLMRYSEEYFIEANQTVLMVASIENVFIDQSIVDDAGYVLHEHADTALVSGLNKYYRTEFNKELPL